MNNDIDSFRIKCLDFYVELCLQIRNRFNFQDKVLEYATVFRPSVARSGDILAISDFKNLFPNLTDIDVDLINQEWQLLSETDLLTKDCDDISDFWAKVAIIKNELGNLMLPNLLIIVKYILSLPHYSAAAERVFSQLSLIKT
ncbi:unnamed protein product [Tenebrio molitor]|jgi:hypothetical protein|nr:unnamed protein product [Tenebrio molitor]